MSITVIYTKENTNRVEMSDSTVVNINDGEMLLNQNDDDCIIIEATQDEDVQVLSVVKATVNNSNNDDVIDITSEEVFKSPVKRKLSLDDHGVDKKKRKFSKCKSFPYSASDSNTGVKTAKNDLELRIDLLNMAFDESNSDYLPDINQETETDKSSIQKQQNASISATSTNSPLPQLSVNCSHLDSNSPLPSLSFNVNQNTPPQKQSQKQPAVISTSPLPQIKSQGNQDALVLAIKSQLTSFCETKRSPSITNASTQSSTPTKSTVSQPDAFKNSDLYSALSKLNLPVYNYPRKNPIITIESGSLLNTQCDAIIVANLVDPSGQVSWNRGLSKQIIDSTRSVVNNSSAVEHDLSNIYSKKLRFNHETKTFDVLLTTSGYLAETTNTKRIFHAHLHKFSYLSDFSEIHFKNTIQSVLKLAIDNHVESIAFPAIGCGELMYPAMLVVKWIDEAFKAFLLSYTCHSLKLIKVVLYDNDVHVNQVFTKFYYQKDTTILKPLDLNLCDEFQLTQLNLGSDEYRVVAARFSETLPLSTIKSIEKVHNVHLEHMYEQSKAMMLKRVPVNTPIEYNLFHGTSTNSINSICRFGFNRSYCGKNGVAYGQGVYFARDAFYSDKYSRAACQSYSQQMYGQQQIVTQQNFQMHLNKLIYHQSQSTNQQSISQLAALQPLNHQIQLQQHQQQQQPQQQLQTNLSMMLSRVLVGCYHKGTPHTKEPELRSNTHQYDSTVDDIQKPTIFVIYRDYRAFPNYIIHYN